MRFLAFSGSRAIKESPTGAVAAWVVRELLAEGKGAHAVPYVRHRGAALVKRVGDVLGSLVLGVVALPVLLVATLAVVLTSPGPPLFCQPRVGFCGKRFGMWKLRTMRLGAEREEIGLAKAARERTFLKLVDDPRVLPAGRWLRRTSIDELPQLLNVLRGEMSLVGPRPLLLSDFEKFPRNRQMRRFTMPPGLTGLWQVSGRSERTDEERMELDLEYVENWSLVLDLKVLWRTIAAVLTGRGAT